METIQIRKSSWYRPMLWLFVLMIGVSLIGGCAEHSESYEKNVAQNPDGTTTTVVEKEIHTESSKGDVGILGGAFHVIGEILAFPFVVVAELFRFIF